MSSPTNLFAGRYHLLRKLGEGGMGTVFLGDDTLLQRQIAIKIPHPHVCITEGVVNRFLREAQMAAQINHPNFCRVYDVGITEGRYFLTMDFIDGTPLSKLITRDNHWPVRDAVDLVRQLAQALQVLHERGIIHRDLKPSNVMIHKDGLPILMDFGLARPLDKSTTLTSHPLGTPGFMAPEQVKADQGEIGPATDIYGLGVILFQLLTGQLPFRGSLMEVFAHILRKPAPPPSSLRADVDSWLDQLCLQALAKDPLQRPASMAEFAGLLQQHLMYAQGEPAATPVKKSTAPAGSRKPTPIPPLERTYVPTHAPTPVPDPTLMAPLPPDPTLFAPVPVVDPTLFAPPKELPPPPIAAPPIPFSAPQAPVIPTDAPDTPVTPVPRNKTVADPPPSLLGLPSTQPPVPVGALTAPTAPVPPRDAPPPAAPPEMLSSGLFHTRTQFTLQAGHAAPAAPEPLVAPRFPSPLVQPTPEALPAVPLPPQPTRRNPQRLVGVLGSALIGLALTVAVATIAYEVDDWDAVWERICSIIPTTSTHPTPPSTGTGTRPENPPLAMLQWGKEFKEEVRLRPGGSTVVEIGLQGDDLARSLTLKASATAQHDRVQVNSFSQRPASQGPDQAAKNAITVEFGRVTDCKPSQAKSTNDLGWSPQQIPVAIHVGQEVAPGNYSIRLEASTPRAGTIESKLLLVVQGKELPPAYIGTLTLIRIPAGFFIMGSPEPSDNPALDCPPRRVIFTRTFYLSETEITEQQYSQIVTPNQPVKSQRPQRDKSFVEVSEFIEQFTHHNDKQGPAFRVRHYRLPREVEWEYACRAGTTSRFAFGDTLTPQQEVFSAGAVSNPDPDLVKEMRAANPWGLYDMHGNVREWCLDVYEARYYKQGEVDGILFNPTGPNVPTKPGARPVARVVRGGAWDLQLVDCLSYRRESFLPHRPPRNIGFRLLCEVPQE